MAEAAIVKEKAMSEASASSGSKKRPTPKRKNELENLEKNFDGKLSALEQKMDKFMDLFSQRVSDTTHGPVHGTGDIDSRAVEVEAYSAARRPPLISVDNSLNRDYGLPDCDDAISVRISDSERRNCDFINDMNDSRSVTSLPVSFVDKDKQTDTDRFSKYVAVETNESDLNVRKLSSMFGKDAQTKNEKQDVGIVLDDSQKQIISQSYRIENPERLTSYKDSYRHSFPVSECCEDFFKVPKLDDTVESLLVKKYGHKAAFGNTPSLFTKSMRSIERLAFQGQLASRMGMVMCCYSQQTLGTLLENLQQKDCNMDLAVQMVRDIFAISTQTLDQVARAGAFDHLIRRRASLYDTGLSDLKDYTSTVNTLPLTAEGVFGQDFDSKLKAKVERHDQLNKLLPPSLFKGQKADNSGNSYKRKSYGGTEQSGKRFRPDDKQYGTKQPSTFLPGFKIPRQNANRETQRKVSFRNFKNKA